MPATATRPSGTVLGVRLKPAVRQQVEAVAAERRMSLSEATRELLALALQQRQHGA